MNLNPYQIEFEPAAKFVVENSNPIEEARLRAIIAGQPAGEDVVEAFIKEQSEEGGWYPFWSTEYVSIDATCFRLAQLESLGVSEHQPVFERALDFLESAQHPGGFWEETPPEPEVLPPWLVPGQVESRVYLTANCLFWLSISGRESSITDSAVLYLEEYVDERGRLPGPLHAQWLAAAACYALDQIELGERLVDPLYEHIPELPASSLAWMTTALLIAGVSREDEVIQKAAERLAGHQKQEGHWSSEDGPDFDVHTTLESMRVFLWLGS